ncbi:synembryn-A-like [Tigriopus californicus]|uniref:synembryn-A-like n=1 Tax=Tigriopus californicus TaxID=6832 RepID=UPI0027D9DAA1|nr:synembryn-A-like [Tigriopus californicus]
MSVNISDFISKHQVIGQPINLAKDEKTSLWNRLLETLQDDAKNLEHLQALTALKIMSRDKTNLDDLIDERMINQLLKFTGIAPDLLRKNLTDQIQAVISEAQRCLHNFLLQSGVARALCAKNETLPGIMNLVPSFRDLNIPHAILVFDLKIAFLITALCQETRKQMYLEQRGVPRLLALIQSLVSNAKDRGQERSGTHPTLSCEEVNVLNEVPWNCINLLNNVPIKCTDPLLGTLKKDIVPSGIEELEYDGSGMNAIQAILNVLLHKIDHPGEDTSLQDAITPVLCVLCNLSRYHRQVRKYLRARILPPLKDVSHRPEVGNDARNKLCKLLTSTSDSVAQTVAEFLFILCKESVSRLVKYSGYGNAAGLLARRGLMLGGRGDNAGNYSDEEDSDTEEYLENAHKVNPIVGCVEPTRPSPFEGMSEEQKEYEAMKLVNLIHELNNVGVVKPAIPGPDGRPQEIDHVLQLQEAAARNAGTANDTNEDSDQDEN